MFYFIMIFQPKFAFFNLLSTSIREIIFLPRNAPEIVSKYRFSPLINAPGWRVYKKHTAWCVQIGKYLNILTHRADGLNGLAALLCRVEMSYFCIFG